MVPHEGERAALLLSQHPLKHDSDMPKGFFLSLESKGQLQPLVLEGKSLA